MFWRGKKVFLTGHTGFKGSWLSLWLQMLGAEVTGYALAPPTSPSLFETASVASGMRSITGDVCDLPHLKTSHGGFEPEIVFHMAAQSLVRVSYQDPILTYQTNVMGTANRFGGCSRDTVGFGCLSHHQRQVLREPRLGPGLPRDRYLGRTRSL